MNLQESTEFEAKFYPVDKDLYRSDLKRIGATLKVAERKMVRIIGDFEVNQNFPKHDYIRVRDEGNKVRLSYKSTAEAGGNVSDQKEIDVDVSDFEKTKKILELCGIKFNRRQETLREEWEYKGAIIAIDTWPGLSTYTEIEADSERMVREIAEDLGFDWGKKIITAVAEVYERVYGIGIGEVLDKISNITFENNPFEGMKKVWSPAVQQEG